LQEVFEDPAVMEDEDIELMTRAADGIAAMRRVLESYR
jgi:hypothetical protein